MPDIDKEELKKLLGTLMHLKDNLATKDMRKGAARMLVFIRKHIDSGSLDKEVSDDNPELLETT